MVSNTYQLVNIEPRGLFSKCIFCIITKVNNILLEYNDKYTYLYYYTFFNIININDLFKCNVFTNWLTYYTLDDEYMSIKVIWHNNFNTIIYSYIPIDIKDIFSMILHI